MLGNILRALCSCKFINPWKQPQNQIESKIKIVEELDKPIEIEEPIKIKIKNRSDIDAGMLRAYNMAEKGDFNALWLASTIAYEAQYKFGILEYYNRLYEFGDIIISKKINELEKIEITGKNYHKVNKCMQELYDRCGYYGIKLDLDSRLEKLKENTKKIAFEDMKDKIKTDEEFLEYIIRDHYYRYDAPSSKPLSASF